MERTLHIDYLTFTESGQVVSYAPKLKLCFNAEKEDDSIGKLKTGTRMLLETWKENNVLDEKITKLGLNGVTTPAQQENIMMQTPIPFYITQQKYDLKDFTINVE